MEVKTTYRSNGAVVEHRFNNQYDLGAYLWALLNATDHPEGIMTYKVEEPPKMPEVIQ